MGLHQVCSALSFLNNDCKLIHGGINSGAVVVTETLDWRLHGFDLLTEHQWQGECLLAASSWAVGSQYKSGEVGRSDWVSLRDYPPWAVDAWGLGCLIQEVYSGRLLQQTEDLRSIDSIPKDLLPYYQKLLASAPDRRMNPAKLQESGVLRNKLVEIVHFLDNLALKEGVEKDAFFKRLSSSLPSIPPPVAQRKLLPALASALEFGGAPSIALSTLLTIGESLLPEERTKRIVPVLSKLFASQDRSIRRGLLENIHMYGASLPDSLVEEQIFNNVAAGFTDQNPYMRELTLKSMVILGPKLGQKTLNQSLLKHLARLQVDEEPSIRANTTVLLGNLAPNLSEATAKKILLNAFSRAMKDHFPPARVAALRAVVSTEKFHTPEEIASRVVPAVAPLCCDQVQEVRVSALDCLDHFTGLLKKHNEEMTRKQAAINTTTTGSGGGGANGTITPSGGTTGAAAGGGGGGGNLLTSFGWAVSSLGLGGGGGTAPSNITGGIGASMNSNSNSSNARIQGFGSSSQLAAGGGQSMPSPPPQPPLQKARGASSLPPPPAAAISPQETTNSGWDDDDDLFEHMEASAAAEEMEARKRLSAMSVSSSGGGGGLGAMKQTGGGGIEAGRRPATRPRARTASGESDSGTAGKNAVVGKKSGGMKLGASKLGATKKLELDDEFGDW